MQWPLLPRFLDIYYHLSAMKGFSDAGGYVTQAFWEYAPAGRPQLYPPLLHVLMLGFFKAGFSFLTIARFFDCFSAMVLLAVIWHVAGRRTSPRAAFLALLLAASSMSLMLASVTLTAFNLAFVFGLFFMRGISQKKTLAAALWLGLCFYTHAWMGFLVFFSGAIHGMLDRTLRGASWRSALGGLLLAAPMLVYQSASRDCFAFVNAKENRLIQIDVFIYLLAIAGAARAFKEKKGLLPVSWILGMMPLLWTHPPRFFAGHGLVGFIFLASVALDGIFGRLAVRGGKKAEGIALLLVASFFLMAAPVFERNTREGTNRWIWGDRTLAAYLRPSGSPFHAKGFTVYFADEYRAIVEGIRAHSRKDELIWSDFPHAGAILAMLADRGTTSGTLAEVRPKIKRDALGDARILVWFKDRNAKAPAKMPPAVRKYRLELLRETEMAYVYQNPSPGATLQPQKAKIPTAVLFLILAIWAALLFYAERAPSP